MIIYSNTAISNNSSIWCKITIFFISDNFNIFIRLKIEVNINKPGIKMILKLANALDLPVMNLFNFKENKK